MLPPSDTRIVAFTGHRPEFPPFGDDENSPSYQALKARLRREIIKFAQLGATIFSCGMARGIDIICGELVVSILDEYPNVSFCCVLPYRNHGQRWPSSWRDRHNALLSKAHWIDCLNETSHRGCFHQRDRYLVECADALIAVYDGRATGGTAYTVQYARKIGVEVIAIDPKQ